MKILTKHTGFTPEHDKIHLTYLIDDNGDLVSCTETIGEKARMMAEHKILEKYDIEEVETQDLKQFIRDNNLSLAHDGHPLILVFYLNRELMGNIDIIEPFSESINSTLALKDANAMALFLPTDGEERIECINPKIINPETQEKVDVLINSITKEFEIGLEEKDLEIKKENPID